MKKLLVFIILLLPCIAAMCQTSNTPISEYDYAMLRIIVLNEDHIYLLDGNNPSYFVQYSYREGNYFKGHSKLDNENVNFAEARFKCFHYLNFQGYELVTSTCYPYQVAFNGLKKRYEYIFKRPKQIGGK